LIVELDRKTVKMANTISNKVGKGKIIKKVSAAALIVALSSSQSRNEILKIEKSSFRFIVGTYIYLKTGRL
jgi:hypothetical protein